MTEHDDDLAAWDDDDLVRALRAPGTATELADQERYLAAFRDAGRSNVRSLPRRAAGRLGAGGTAVVVTVALTSGVAAAYTGHLPDAVQQIAHTVIGAPAPAVEGRHHPDASGPHGGPLAPGSTEPAAPSSTAPGGSTGTPSSSGGSVVPGASTSPSDHPGTGHVSQAAGGRPSGGPTAAPTTSPSSSPSSSSGGAATAMSMSAPTHRVGVGQALTLTGVVTDVAGAALPGHPVVLQVRGPRHWRRVAETTSDDTGVVSAVTPAITRSGRFRWRADRGVTSTPWLVRMVPTLAVSADVGGATTTITATAQGSTSGDRIQLYRHAAGHPALIRRAQLSDSGSAAMQVATPRRHATYVVRLLPTKRHAAARAHVVVVPPAPASLSISGAASRVGVGGSTVIGGTVTSASGDALPGHRVVLMRRGPARWRPVGHALSDATGHVAIGTPAILATSRFRLRTDHGVSSAAWRVVSLPSLSASAQPGDTTVAITASATGGRAGDRVVLLRRLDGRLVRMRHAPLGADGSVTFTVPRRKVRTTYVVRLLATKRHGAASTSVTVAKPG
jgi:hypothetical protein